MTTRNKFYLKDNGSEKKLTIHRCREPPTRDTWHEFDLSLDELDELRRILGIGMGDCDHCPAWLPYIESTKKAAQEDVEGIVKDRNRLRMHQLWLKGHTTVLGNHANRITELEKRVEEINASVWSLNGTLRDVTKALNNVADEHYKIKDFVGMKHP